MKKLLTFFLLLLLVAACSDSEPEPSERFSVLVFSKTAGYRHASIPAGQQAIFELGKTHDFTVDTTENATLFSDENLTKYAAVIFLNTTLDVLDKTQQTAFENYIRSGGGFVGIHSAADTEYDWPWYGKLVGAYFKNHPPGTHEATVRVAYKNHAATSNLPNEWVRVDEWYNFRDVNPAIHTICHLDESTYEGGEMGDLHPISWWHEYDGGRAFYTGMGHTIETFSEPLIREHLLGGIRYAAGR